ncbi:MAG: ABC transporter ATP-binding protein [Planctomycetes bacterium]|nr:ABC transporter ATP-binding protein [Planctomycetota bacterium]
MIELHEVAFHYAPGAFGLRVDEFAVARGEAVACIGPSGSGKSTLIQLISGILVPDQGRVLLDGRPMSSLSDAERRARRSAEIGFVFQEFELLEYLTALDNILLPFRIGRDLCVDREARERAIELAEHAGIGSHLGRRPRRLSHGERQRVAVCRALVTQPSLVIADEPTGNLDPDTGRAILDLLFAQVRERGSTLLTVTHDHGVLDRFDRVVDVRDLARVGVR